MGGRARESTRARAARVRRRAGVGALVLVLAALLGAGVAAAGPGEGDEGDPSSTSTTATSTTTTTSSTTTTVPPTTTTTPLAVEPLRGPATDSTTPTTTAGGPSGPVVLATVRPEHDDEDCWDGESDLATTTDLNGQRRVLLGRTVQFEVHVRNATCAEHDPPQGVVQLWRLAPGAAAAEQVDELTLDSGGATRLEDDHARTPGSYLYWAEYLGMEGGWSGDDGPYVPGFLPSTSEDQPVDVVGVATRVLLFAGTGYLYEGNDVTLTALVETVPDGGPTPLGFVTFQLDSTYRTVQLQDGIAQITVSQPSLGEHVYRAEYGGYEGEDGDFGLAPDVAEVSVFVAAPPAPIVEITSTPPSGSTIEEGTTVTFSSTITSPWIKEGGPTFPGTVTYLEDGETAGSSAVGESFSWVPGPGEHQYTAVYQGSPGSWSPSESTNVVLLTVNEAAATTTTTSTTAPTTTTTTTAPTTSTTSTTAPPNPTTVPPTTAPPATSSPTTAPPGTGTGVGTAVGGLAARVLVGREGTPSTPPTTEPPASTTTTSTPPTTEPPDGGLALGRTESAGVDVVVDTDAPATRSALVSDIPTPDDVDLGYRHMGGNLILTLLLILLIALPAELFNSTLKEHYHRVNRPLKGIQAWLAAVEEHFKTLPNPVLLVGFAVVGALIAGQLDPNFGLNPTSLVMFGALALAFVVITLVLELARIPYLDRRAGRRRRHHLRLFPLVLILGAIFVAVSRLAEFRPGYIFGITCGLLLADDVGEEDNARSLVVAAVLLLATSIGAWLLWLPFVDPVQEASPSLFVLFADAFLATLWVSCLQVVVFGYAPLEALYGKIVQRWHLGAWLAVYGAAMFLLVSFLLHPSAGRWGSLTTTTFLQMMSLFVVFLVASVVLWAWFRFRPDPTQKGADEAPAVTSDQG